MSILAEIFAHKRQEVALARREMPLAKVQAAAAQAAPALDFTAALRTAAQRHASPALIAEVKAASPSRGLLVADFDPLRLAKIYATNGAAAISVLTDERYFKGHLDYLRQVRRQHPDMPLLCKDFVCDPYQVYEGRAGGADAVLLIVAELGAVELMELQALVHSLGMAALVEVHTETELETALACQASLIGINNRDLHTFQTSLETSLHLLPMMPGNITVVAESGIHQAADAQRLGQAGIDAILVGEALVTALDTALAVRELSNVGGLSARSTGGASHAG